MAMLQVTGGMASLALALAAWAHDQHLGPTVGHIHVVAPIFLLSGLGALITASIAVAAMTENVRFGELSETDPEHAWMLFFLIATLLLLGIAYVMLFVTMSE